MSGETSGLRKIHAVDALFPIPPTKYNYHTGYFIFYIFYIFIYIIFMINTEKISIEFTQKETRRES